MNTKHILNLDELTSEEIRGLLGLALDVKQRPHKYDSACLDKWLVMLFQKTSTRTRISFDMGMQKLGGRTVVMNWKESNVSISPLRYELGYISSQCDLIMARLIKHQDLQEMTMVSPVPVINGCDDVFHPCQALADILTIYELGGNLAQTTVCYVGIHNNVANSLMIIAYKLGVKLLLVTPEISEDAWREDIFQKALQSGLVRREENLKHAVEQADYVYTDTWVDMEHAGKQDSAEMRQRIEKMMPYQVNTKLLAGSKALLLHPMPTHPGYEVDAEILETERCKMYHQASNRIFVQQALILYLLHKADIAQYRTALS